MHDLPTTFRALPAPDRSMGRRGFLAPAAGGLAAASTAGARGRDFGPAAPPVRYPDPDTVDEKTVVKGRDVASMEMEVGGRKRNRLFMAGSQSLYAAYCETRGAHIT